MRERTGAYLILGWSGTNERAVILTERQVISVDPATKRVDAREVAHQRSLRIPFGPIVALAKTPPPRPAVQIAPDLRTAYVVASHAAAPWRPGVSVVDLERASVRATYFGERSIWGIRLSGDASRLFVLAGDPEYSGGGSELVVLDPATGNTITSMRIEAAAIALISGAP